MLVRFAVGSAAAGAGAVLAAGATGATGVRTSDLFDGMAWGEVSGKEVMAEAEAHWNDNGMGHGKPCSGTGGSLTACKPGSQQLSRYMWFSKGVWAFSKFWFDVFWEHDGCNITNLYFQHRVEFNNLRAQSTKFVIQQIRIEPTTEYKPAECVCSDENKPIISKPRVEGVSAEGEMSSQETMVDVEKGRELCCCTPAVIKIVVSFQLLHRSVILADDATSRNWTFIIAADGYGTSRSDAA